MVLRTNVVSGVTVHTLVVNEPFTLILLPSNCVHYYCTYIQHCKHARTLYETLQEYFQIRLSPKRERTRARLPEGGSRRAPPRCRLGRLSFSFAQKYEAREKPFMFTCSCSVVHVCSTGGAGWMAVCHDPVTDDFMIHNQPWRPAGRQGVHGHRDNNCRLRQGLGGKRPREEAGVA